MGQSVVASPEKYFGGPHVRRRGSGRGDRTFDAEVVTPRLRVADVDVIDAGLREKSRRCFLRSAIGHVFGGEQPAPACVSLERQRVRKEIRGEAAVFRVPLARLFMD